MGLCKCSKKKVTNLFCFEHRVNVCEHCLVNNHKSCVVQSYLQWLQDSDYNPNCVLCGQTMQGEDVIRLLCLDVFHWGCLNKYAKQFPANTAPAGYQCPSCTQCIFPPSNQASPIADQLRNMLSQVNWSRVGLGLPLIDEPQEQRLAAKADLQPPTQTSSAAVAGTASVADLHPSSDSYAFHQDHSSVVDVGDATGSHDRTEHRPLLAANSSPRRVFDSTSGHETMATGSLFDVDDNKYKRRSAMELFGRWFKSRSTSRRNVRDPNAMYKKFAFIVVAAMVGLLTLLLVMNRLGRSGDNDDPLLDPMANPNIRVADVVPN
ncbi:PREDICTED: zinc finger protein-like 1 [Priapulus caudatus]|uniref:Zinc finger protein-like 1 homolog n=1 Tax=Priapulus caudatus TaxID=37621 RepID=A0ABM1DPY7_PRICU|nr:PREDICTED: zinc finger protein-like 1 [Priapulus caudatus]